MSLFKWVFKCFMKKQQNHQTPFKKQLKYFGDFGGGYAAIAKIGKYGLKLKCRIYFKIFTQVR